MKPVLIIVLLFFIKYSSAQSKTLTESEFIAIVKKYHPVVKLSDNNIRIAKWDIISAKGAFDPQWQSERFGKAFDGTKYYDQTSHEIKIPTWYGIDIYAGQETINGDRTNPQETKGSLTYYGISVSPIQNLVMDKRRAALLLAKNYFQLSAVEQQIAINDLLKEALETYWNWWEQFHIYELMNKGLANAKKRLEFVKSASQLGERPAIDTLEAFTQVQYFTIKVSEAFTELFKTQIILSSFLWTDNLSTVTISSDVIPENISTASPVILDDVLNNTTNHPELMQYNYKLNGLNIERRLKFQLLLPEVKFKYNQPGRSFSKLFNEAWFTNNYNYGISISMPLRLSEGRSEYAKTKLKIQNAQVEQKNRLVQLQVNVKQHFNQWQQLNAQVSTQEQLVKNYFSLQQGEEIKFINGESNLFLTNARELKFIESEEKLIELRSKKQQAYVKLYWSAGLLTR